MARTVDIESKLVAPDAPTVGRILSSLTVVLKNQNGVTKDTLTYPSGITQLYDGSTGYSYKINDYDVDDISDWPGTYLIANFTGVDQATGQTSTWPELVFFAIDEAIPTVDEGREPYADLAYALLHANELRYGADLRNYIANEPANAYRLLIEASDDVDSENYKGQKLRVFAWDNQMSARQWPRVFDYHETVGYFAGSTEFLPVVVKQATVEQAIWILKQDETGHDYKARSELQARGLTGVSRGSSSENWDLASSKRNHLCNKALQLLAPFLARTASGYPGGI